MAEITQKLHYRKSGVTTDIKLYNSISDMGPDYLSLRVNGTTVYAMLGDAGEHEASDLRVRKDGTTYTVLKTNRIELPSGFIAMFNTSCPSGWTRETAFDNLFLKGGSSYGALGGSDSHSHTVTVSAATSSTKLPPEVDFSMYTEDKAAAQNASHSHSLPAQSFETGTETTLPPYVNVIFCRKL